MKRFLLFTFLFLTTTLWAAEVPKSRTAEDYPPTVEIWREATIKGVSIEDEVLQREEDNKGRVQIKRQVVTQHYTIVDPEAGKPREYTIKIYEEWRELRFWAGNHGYLSLPMVLCIDMEGKYGRCDGLVDVVYVFDYIHKTEDELTKDHTQLTRISGFEGMDFNLVDLYEIKEKAATQLRNQLSL